ncbi:hypothetical protein PR048_003169 [Dryococelus australis]|uniref:Uncharacterized protein n=1 Tax=Dryococelus australis TaxID=614101 RepID=A0ABQ9IN98_9NEOP|nr:hypothetical protein PR048_003169 [Dryococelus australis]
MILNKGEVAKLVEKFWARLGRRRLDRPVVESIGAPKLDGLGNCLPWPAPGNNPAFAWSDFGKPGNSVQDIWTGIRNWVIQNAKQSLLLSHFPLRKREKEIVGSAVVERLAYLPPTKAKLVHTRIFACGNRAGRCLWSEGFLLEISFPPSCHSGTAPPQLPSSALKTSLLRATQLLHFTSFRTPAHELYRCPPSIPSFGWEFVFHSAVMHTIKIPDERWSGIFIIVASSQSNFSGNFSPTPSPFLCAPAFRFISGPTSRRDFPHMSSLHVGRLAVREGTCSCEETQVLGCVHFSVLSLIWRNSFLYRSWIRSRIEFRTTVVKPGGRAGMCNGVRTQDRCLNKAAGGRDVFAELCCWVSPDENFLLG